LTVGYLNHTKNANYKIVIKLEINVSTFFLFGLELLQTIYAEKYALLDDSLLLIYLANLCSIYY